MADKEKLFIEILRNKTVEEFTKDAARIGSKVDVGSICAQTAALSSALFYRAAEICRTAVGESDESDYLVRNAEILRNYMVNLIDEDVKSRGPLRMALREGDQEKIEAAYQPASCISIEIISMMITELELIDKLLDNCSEDMVFNALESAELAMSTIYVAQYNILSMSRKCTDETYRYVSRRENELSCSRAEELIASIRAKAQKYLK